MSLPEKHLKCRALEQEIINNCEECKELTGQYCSNEQLRRKQDEEQFEADYKHQFEEEQRKQQAIAEEEARLKEEAENDICPEEEWVNEEFCPEEWEE